MPIDDRCLIEAELRARAEYAKPGRHYHDESHLNDCLRQLHDVRDLSEDDRRLLRWAILWHDCIYDPGRGDNEQKSADRAYADLTACGVVEPEAAEVARLILLTRAHQVQEGDRRGALLVSIDLSILGADPKSYQAYSQAVRREYAHIIDPEWRQGRAFVLKDLLAAALLYPDPDFRRRFEAKARRNIEEELRTLGAGSRLPV